MGALIARNKWVGLRVLGAILMATALQASAAPPESSGKLTLVVVDVLPAAHVWHSRQSRVFDADGKFTVGYWPMDVESQPRSGKGRLIGIIMVGRGDAGETPIALQAWSDVDRTLEPAEREGAQGEGLSFRLQDVSCGTDCKSAPESLAIDVSPTGEVVVNGEAVGVIH